MIAAIAFLFRHGSQHHDFTVLSRSIGMADEQVDFKVRQTERKGVEQL